MGATCEHNPLRSILVPNAIHSPALRSTIPLTITAFEAIDKGKSITPESIEQRGIVMNLINENLRDPEKACSDPNIGAITALMGFEVGALL